MNPADFEFTAIELTSRIDPATRAPTASVAYPILDIRPQDTTSGEFFGSVWSKFQLALKSHLQASGKAVPSWCHWQVAQWCSKPPVANELRFAAWCGSVMVGFLNLLADFPSHNSPGKKLVYVDHVASSPGNIPTELWGSKIAGVGKALVAYAVLESFKAGCDGRIGLHADSAEAQDFYDRLNGEMRGRLFTAYRTGAAGPLRPGQLVDPNLTKNYTEALEAGAKDFLERFRK